jgi:hypothetical protein
VRSESVSSHGSARSDSPKRHKKHHSKKSKRDKEEKKKAKKLRMKDTPHQDRSPSPGMKAIQDAAAAAREDEARARAEVDRIKAERDREVKARRLADLRREYGEDREPTIRFKGRGNMVYRCASCSTLFRHLMKARTAMTANKHLAGCAGGNEAVYDFAHAGG